MDEGSEVGKKDLGFLEMDGPNFIILILWHKKYMPIFKNKTKSIV